MAKKESVKKNSEALVKTESRPAFLTKAPARGLEEADQKDLNLPRLGLCQSTSPQRKKQNPLYIENLEEGDFFNSLTGEVYGTKVDVVPIFLFKSRIKFHDFEDGGGIDCQSFNAKDGGRLSLFCDTCAFSTWLTKENKQSPPECTLLYNYVCVQPTDLSPFVVTLKSKSTKAAKNWNSMMKLRNADTFAGVYQLGSIDDRVGTNDFKNVQIKNLGWSTEEVYKFAEGVYSSLKGKTIQVDLKGLDHEDSEPAPF